MACPSGRAIRATCLPVGSQGSLLLSLTRYLSLLGAYNSDFSFKNPEKQKPLDQMDDQGVSILNKKRPLHSCKGLSKTRRRPPIAIGATPMSCASDPDVSGQDAKGRSIYQSFSNKKRALHCCKALSKKRRRHTLPQ